jgi:GntR family transcriptional repressor for pyruvate dehydrogenase complex
MDFFDSISLKDRRNISGALFEQLRESILCGELPSGYTFPNENDLCQALNIGRGTLREAYASLETLHLITRSKLGTYVNSQEDIQNYMNFQAIAQHVNSRTLSEYRTIIEVGAVRLAAQNISQEEIDELDRIVNAMELVQDDPERLSQYDFDFHSMLIHTTKNQLLTISFNTIRAIYEDFTERVFSSGYVKQSFMDHRAIVDALRAKNPSLAAKMMTAHLSHVEGFRTKI